LLNGGQTIYGGTLTTQSYNDTANKADTSTGNITLKWIKFIYSERWSKLVLVQTVPNRPHKLYVSDTIKVRPSELLLTTTGMSTIDKTVSGDSAEI